jgi:uncharacterized protein YqjF (DUF2071 family)
MDSFLKAEWRRLAMANYVVDKSLLENYLPPGTEIDRWRDRCYVSLVGFMFLNTSVMGMKIPFHINFEEVNLRFYVRYNEGDPKRGVVFIKEIVPKPALTWVANTLYQEHYVTLPMKHSWELMGGKLMVGYQWKKEKWNSFQVTAGRSALDIETGSEEEFITEHYWGYTKRRDGTTSEYAVEHPRWQVYPTTDYSIAVDFASVYGEEFGFLRGETPASVFLAEGSEILVRRGKRI